MPWRESLRYPAPTPKQWLENAPRYSRFTASLKKFSLLDRLAGPGPFVVLALPNEVYDRYGIDDAALENIDTTTYEKAAVQQLHAQPEGSSGPIFRTRLFPNTARA